ncbi:STM4015 family protein [Actinocorallia longicatena]|uniref:STM4015 family protein n=1 Tax=Actinocorallia longicatena TaxID=111803 RepID=A0ABP6QHZ0_9ACTN
MSLHQHVTEFAGLPVVDLTEESDLTGLPAPEGAAWRLRIDDFVEEFEPFRKLFAAFLEAVDTTKITALVVANWGACHAVNAREPLDLLVAAAGRFPALRAIFWGEYLQEESEISWIEQCDITPIFTSFPALETVTVRGGSGLRLEPVTSKSLRELRFETGGLPGVVVRAVAASDLPALESLVLWLGVDEYGGDATIADLAPILSGERLPALRHLGLQDAEIQDDVAAAIAGAPIVARLTSLDLSMGVLTDEGAEALLSGQPLGHLTSLDLSHHYLTEPMTARLAAALPGVALDLGEPQEEDDDWRYVAVAE